MPELNLAKLNSEIVRMRKNIKRAINHVINKHVKNIKRFNAVLQKSTDSDISSNNSNNKIQQKLSHAVEEIQICKKLHPDTVAKYAIINVSSFSNIARHADCLQRVLGRVTDHNLLTKEIVAFRIKYPNWNTEIPPLLKFWEKNKGKKEKRKEIRSKKKEKIQQKSISKGNNPEEISLNVLAKDEEVESKQLSEQNDSDCDNENENKKIAPVKAIKQTKAPKKLAKGKKERKQKLPRPPPIPKKLQPNMEVRTLKLDEAEEEIRIDQVTENCDEEEKNKRKKNSFFLSGMNESDDESEGSDSTAVKHNDDDDDNDEMSFKNSRSITNQSRNQNSFNFKQNREPRFNNNSTRNFIRPNFNREDKRFKSDRFQSFDTRESMTHQSSQRRENTQFPQKNLGHQRAPGPFRKESSAPKNESIHPSWAAQKKLKEQATFQKFQGKKITFDD